jgi:hypothetical protein
MQNIYKNKIKNTIHDRNAALNGDSLLGMAVGNGQINLK